MSFDLFVQYFSRGQEAFVPLESILEKFAPHAKQESATIWNIVYDHENACTLCIGEIDEKASQRSMH